MRSLAFALLAPSSILAWTAAAALTFSATATHGGKEVDTSGLEFLPIPFRSQHRRNSTSTSHRQQRGSRDKRAAVSYSDNWCGVSQHSTASNPITSVSGIFSTPSLTIRPSEPIPQFAAAWIGIDGASCQQSLLQAGTQTVVNSNGGQSASAWWQWVPNASYAISGFPVKPGDWIAINITASSPTNGIIVMTNYNQEYSLTIDLKNGPELCRLDADWIVEDFDSADGQVSFPRFGDVWFEECAATTASGKDIGLDGAAMIYLGPDQASASCLAAPYDNANFYCYSQN